MSNNKWVVGALVVAVVAVLVGGLLSLSLERDVQTGPALKTGMVQSTLQSPVVYAVPDEEGPRLTGTVLKVASSIVRLPIIGDIVVGMLLNMNFMYHVRELNAKLSADPTDNFEPLYYPVHVPSPQELATHAQLAAGAPVSSLEDALAQYTARRAEKAETFRFWRIEDYASAYKNGKTDPVEVVKRVVQFVRDSDAGDQPLKAVISMSEELSLVEAEASAKRWRKGSPLSLLDGIPVFVKDEIPVKGFATTSGTSFLHKQFGIEKEDNLIVKKLREAGAIIVGKSGMHEIGIGTSGYNSHYGTMRNPVNLNHYPGGSSSGSGALVGAGIVPLAIGTDGGGSVRIPATFCGVSGLKATFDRFAHFDRECFSVTHPGPIAATVRDVIIAYSALAGEDSAQPLSVGQPAPHLAGVFDTKDLSGLRIGVYPEWNNHVRDVEIPELLNQTLSKLAARGAQIKEIAIPHLGAFNRAHTVTILTEMVTAMDGYWTEHASEFDAETVTSLALGRQLSARDFFAAMRVRRFAWKILKQIYQSVDLIILPATGSGAFELLPDAVEFGESNIENVGLMLRHSALGNFLGIPSGVVRVGYNSAGLPLAVQVMGDHWNEHHVLRVMLAVEEFSPEPRKPQMFFSVLHKQ